MLIKLFWKVERSACTLYVFVDSRNVAVQFVKLFLRQATISYGSYYGSANVNALSSVTNLLGNQPALEVSSLLASSIVKRIRTAPELLALFGKRDMNKNVCGKLV